MAAVVPAATTQEAMLRAWEEGLPRKDDLPPSHQQLLTPVLADAFGIALSNSMQQSSVLTQQQQQVTARQEMPTAYPAYHSALTDPNRLGSHQTAPPPPNASASHQSPAANPYATYHHQMPPQPQNTAPSMQQNNAPPTYPYPVQYPPQYQPQPQHTQRGYEMYRPQEHHQPIPPPQGVVGGDPAPYAHVGYQGMDPTRTYGDFKRQRDELSLSMSGEGPEEDHARALKRPRLVWTPPLHKRFVDAVSHLGIKNAVPKTIMQLMNVEGLTRENVASHLQKYRLYLKRLQGCSESTMENSPSQDGGIPAAPLSPGKGNSGGSEAEGGNSGNLPAEWERPTTGTGAGGTGTSSDEETAGAAVVIGTKDAPAKQDDKAVASGSAEKSSQE